MNMDTVIYNISLKDIEDAMKETFMDTFEIIDKLENDPILSKVYKELYE
jgi:hypothetical protein